MPITPSVLLLLQFTIKTTILHFSMILIPFCKQLPAEKINLLPEKFYLLYKQPINYDKNSLFTHSYLKKNEKFNLFFCIYEMFGHLHHNTPPPLP